MRIISERTIREFWEVHARSEGAFREWIKTVRAARWTNFAEVRQTFATADQVGKLTVVNVGGNKFRMIIAIHFDRGTVYIRGVLTHKDYDRGAWKP